MIDQIPPGFIPEEESLAPAKTELQPIPPGFEPEQKAADPIPPGFVLEQPIPPGFVPESDYKPPLSPKEQEFKERKDFGINLIESMVSGASLGVSRKAETAMGVHYEDMKKRRQDNPVSTVLGEIAGTYALLRATGGLALLGIVAEGGGFAARLGIAGIEGGIIGGTNQATDDWSANKPLDGEKIGVAAAAGFLIGGLSQTVFEGLGKLYKGIKEAGQAASSQGKIEGPEIPPPHEPGPNPEGPYGAGRPGEGPAAHAPVIEVEFGKVPDTWTEAQNIVAEAKKQGMGTLKPQVQAFERAYSLVGKDMKFPPTEAQILSLGDQSVHDLLSILKATPNSDVGEVLTQWDILQKGEDIVPGIDRTIREIAPGYEPAVNKVDAGQRVSRMFKDVLLQVREEVGKIIADKRNQVIAQVDHVPGILQYLDKNNKISRMIEVEGGQLHFNPWNGGMGMAEQTYKNIRHVIEVLQRGNIDLDTLFNLRDHLEEGVDLTKKGKASFQLANAKKDMMDYITAVVPGEFRPFWRRYAQNEEAIARIEESAGAKVESSDFISAARYADEEGVLANIFSGTNLLKDVKQILGPEKFSKLLADYVNLNRLKNTKDYNMSFNKFETWMNTKQDVLREAFSDNPMAMERLRAWNTIGRMLPDQTSSVMGSGRTNLSIADRFKKVDLSLQGILKAVPKKLAAEIDEYYKYQKINELFKSKATKQKDSEAFKEAVKAFSEKMDKKIKLLFQSTASQSKKVNKDGK